MELHKDESLLMAPFDYLYGVPGKNVRTHLMNTFNMWLHVPPNSLSTIIEVVNILHTASLLIDDIEDSSPLRRGLPAAYIVFGVPQTINSANYMYFRALEQLQSLKQQDATGIFISEMLQLHRGQGMDLYWRDALACPTEEEYLDMVGNKTGGLFRLAIRLMLAESPISKPPDCLPLGHTLGVLFQIRDNYQNVASEEYTRSKGMCEDLSEGKFSFPIIHGIRNDPNRLRLFHILKSRPTALCVKQYVVEYLKKTGSLEYTRNTVDRLILQAKEMAIQLGGKQQSMGIHALLDKLAI